MVVFAKVLSMGLLALVLLGILEKTVDKVSRSISVESENCIHCWNSLFTSLAVKVVALNEN